MNANPLNMLPIQKPCCHSHSSQEESLQKDPVCGMTVDPRQAAAQFAYHGTTYFFCCSSCATKFKANPEKYLQGAIEPMGQTAAIASARISGTNGQYTCPMHPEVLQTGPGTCPKCGMALEPLMPTSVEGPDPELALMTQRFVVGAVLALPVFLIAMGSMLPLPGWTTFLHRHMPSLNWLQLLLTTPVVFWCGGPFLQRAVASVVHRTPNMFTLISLGVGAAYAYSLLATVAPQWFPSALRMADGSVEPYFDSAAVIVVLALLGQILELRARAETSGAIKALLGLTPKTASRVQDDGVETEVPIEEIQVGDRLRLRPGERVPVDGFVLEGETSIDESMVTGESMPVKKDRHSPLIAGSINGPGSVLMEAEKVGSDTLLSRIVQRVADAQRSRAPIEKLVNRISSIFVPAVLVIAALTFTGWSMWGTETWLAEAMVHSVAVLIIACPCALGLATPMAIMVGTGRGASMGILFRDVQGLETLRKVDTLVIDKTGTLTAGKPSLVTLEALAGQDEFQLLNQAASLETVSEHPLAQAIVNEAKARNCPLSTPTNFESITGKGVTGIVNGKRIAVGNEALMTAKQVDFALLADRLTPLREAGQTVLLVSVEGTLAGLLGVSDPVKPQAKEVLKLLSRDGLRVIMLTGDHHATAHQIAQQLGLTEVIAEVLPEQKGDTITSLQKQGRCVAMAGDGINDAPALASADVGIAMGTGTDIAMESADVTLVKGDLTGIVRARRLSQATTSAIRQNLFLAFAYNAISVPLAALGFISPLWASVAMSLSSVSVLINSLRLKRTPI